MAMGFFLVLVLEQVILAFKDQPQMKECRALLPNSSVNSHRHGASEESGGSLFHVDLSAQSALRSFVLVFSLSLHSVLEGLAVGLQEIYVARQGKCIYTASFNTRQFKVLYTNEKHALRNSVTETRYEMVIKKQRE